jgi:hypothetical protein
MAFLGLIYLLKEQRLSDEVREFRKVAGSMNPAAAHGMAAGRTLFLLPTINL